MAHGPVEFFLQERAFGAAGGSYGRAALGAGRKPGSSRPRAVFRGGRGGFAVS